jgi:hypothetical protein
MDKMRNERALVLANGGDGGDDGGQHWPSISISEARAQRGRRGSFVGPAPSHRTRPGRIDAGGYRHTGRDSNYMNGGNSIRRRARDRRVFRTASAVRRAAAAVPPFAGLRIKPCRWCQGRGELYASGEATRNSRPLMTGQRHNGNNVPDGTEQCSGTRRTTYHPAHWDSDGNGLPNDGADRLAVSWQHLAIPENDWGRQVVLQLSERGFPGLYGHLQGNKCYTPGWWAGGAAPKTARGHAKTCSEPNSASPSIPSPVTNTCDKPWTTSSTDPALRGTRPQRTRSWGDRLVGSSFGNRWIASKRVWIVAMVALSDAANAVRQNHRVQQLHVILEGCRLRTLRAADAAV